MPGRRKNLVTNQLNREAVITATADQNYLETWRWTVDHVDVGSCENDWKCAQSACANLNDSSSEICSGVGCQTPRPKHWRACGVSLPLATRKVVITLGDGSSDEVVLKPSQGCMGKFIPVDKRNQLQVSKHNDIEKLFGIKMVVVDTSDQTAGNLVCFHSQTFTNSTIVTALNNCEPVKNKPVEITYNAETLSTTPNNIQVRVVLVPKQKIPSNEIPVNTCKKYTVDELLEHVQKTNDALTAACPGCIQLDNTEMSLSRIPDLNLGKVNRPMDAYKKMNPTLVDELMRLSAKQDVTESIENKDRMLRHGIALYDLSIGILMDKRIQLIAAGKKNTAVDCVMALQKEFPKDGSNAKKFFKRITRIFKENFTVKTKYAFDEAVSFVVARCAVTGKENVEIKTTPNGENQRNACTPNVLRFLQEGREQNLRRISKQSTPLDVFNEQHRQIRLQGNDCEDGAEETNSAMHAAQNCCERIANAEQGVSYTRHTTSRPTLALQNMPLPQKSSNKLTKIEIYQRCVGDVVDEITSDKAAYTAEERRDLRQGICMLWLHMSEACGTIAQSGKAMTGLWFAGGASQTLQTTEQSNEDDNKVISIANESVKFMKECEGKAGHAAMIRVDVHEDKKVAEQKIMGGSVAYYAQEDPPEPCETTAAYYISTDEENAQTPVETTVFCENAADAMQLQQEECIGKLFGKSNEHNIASNYLECRENWLKISNANALQTGSGVSLESTPCVTKQQSMAFYVGILHASLWDANTQQMAPGVTVDTANKLANKSSGGVNDNIHVVVPIYTNSDPKLEKYAKAQKAWADNNDPHAVRSRMNSKKLHGALIWKEPKIYGNSSQIDLQSQNCVAISFKGALTAEQCAGGFDSEKVMHEVEQLTVVKHAKNLNKCNEDWGMIIIPRTTLDVQCILKTNAYPRTLHETEQTMQTLQTGLDATTMAFQSVQGRRWNFLAQ